MSIDTDDVLYFGCFRCGNVAAILELDEHLKREFTIFEAAPQVGYLTWRHFVRLVFLIVMSYFNITLLKRRLRFLQYWFFFLVGGGGVGGVHPANRAFLSRAWI